MWSYTVRSRANAANPVPVAGISFANIGDQTNSRPLLFVTTADGQIICLNAKAADVRTPDQDGDPGTPLGRVRPPLAVAGYLPARTRLGRAGRPWSAPL